MLQILKIVDWNEIGFNILSGLYGSVAKVYDIMLRLAEYKTEEFEPFQITAESIANTMYVLAGVFMLFRVTISMINYLIDPDKLNDKQAGAGKVLARVVTSLLMIIIFVPGGWVFSKDPNNKGILARLEEAILAPNGLIDKLMPDITPRSSESNRFNTVFSDNVYADGDDFMDCYYIYVINNKNANTSKGSRSTGTDKSKTQIEYDSGFLHITFYNSPATTDSNREALCVNNTKDCDKYSYTIEVSNDGLYKKPKYANSIKDQKNVFNKGWPSSCPTKISSSGVIDNLKKGETWKSPGVTGYVGGWKTKEELKNATESKENITIAAPEGADTSAMEAATGATTSHKVILDVTDESLSFAQHSLGAFVSCAGAEDCDELRYGKDNSPETGMLASMTANKKVIGHLNEEPSTMNMDFMIGVIVGIGLFIWNVFLCVDVLVRKFKLMLLEIIAPIPIISYSDPNDKMFNQWGKMYINTYLDLFIKLFALAFVIRLLQFAPEVLAGRSGLETLFFIIAILVFGKAVPDLISNIFGIKLNSGSFKNIASMGKAVLGVGAGAAIGGAAGIATGISTFKASKGQSVGNRLLEVARGTKGVLNGMAQGAGAGSKGKIFAGAKSIAETNASVRNKYASGLKASHLLEGATLGRIGMNYASTVDREVAKDIATKDKIMKLTKHQGAISNLAKEGGLMQAVLKAESAGHNIDTNARNKLTFAYAQAMLDNEDANVFKARMEQDAEYGQIYKDLFADQNTFAFEWGNKDSFIDGGVAAQIKSEIAAFDDEITGSPSLAKVVGKTSIRTVADVKEANLKAWNGRDEILANGTIVHHEGVNDINDRIREKTIRDPKYNASKAAAGSSNSNNNANR